MLTSALSAMSALSAGRSKATYRYTEEFSASQNPNSNWSYGYRTGINGALVLLPGYSSVAGGWSKDSEYGDFTIAGLSFLHPPSDITQLTAVEFKSSSTGTVLVSASVAANPGSPDGVEFFLVNGGSVVISKVLNASEIENISVQLNVTKDSVISFNLSPRSSHGSDSTTFSNCQIRYLLT